MPSSDNFDKTDNSQELADRLIGRIAEGDMSALEQLYREMYIPVYRFLLSMLCGNTHSAEDLAQETFIRVFRYAPKFTAMGQGRSWVYRIASRLALTHLSDKRGKWDELGDTLPCGWDMEENVIFSQSLHDAMAMLPDEERQIVSMHAVTGLTLNEIAFIIGRPLGTVKWLHAKAVKTLRQLLGIN